MKFLAAYPLYHTISKRPASGQSRLFVLVFVAELNRVRMYLAPFVAAVVGLFPVCLLNDAFLTDYGFTHEYCGLPTVKAMLIVTNFTLLSVEVDVPVDVQISSSACNG